MANFSESGHPIFRASSAFERGELRSKGHGKKSIHFNGNDENIELLLRTVISANQLSVELSGAEADHVKRWRFLLASLAEIILPSSEKRHRTHVFFGSRFGIAMEFRVATFTLPVPSADTRTFSHQCTATEKLGARIRAKIRTIVRRPEIIQIML